MQRRGKVVILRNIYWLFFFVFLRDERVQARSRFSQSAVFYARMLVCRVGFWFVDDGNTIMKRGSERLHSFNRRCQWWLDDGWHFWKRTSSALTRNGRSLIISDDLDRLFKGTSRRHFPRQLGIEVVVKIPMILLLLPSVWLCIKLLERCVYKCPCSQACSFVNFLSPHLLLVNCTPSFGICNE